MTSMLPRKPLKMTRYEPTSEMVILKSIDELPEP